VHEANDHALAVGVLAHASFIPGFAGDMTTAEVLLVPFAHRSKRDGEHFLKRVPSPGLLPEAIHPRISEDHPLLVLQRDRLASGDSGNL
jgi:hypothetical protein